MNGLARADFGLKVLFYGAFGLLLLALLLFNPAEFLPVLITAALSFALVTLLRRLIDAPRPYEITGIAPAIPRDAHGRSFPSRHVFSAFMIATLWWTISPWVAIALSLCAVAIAIIRVRGGVHFPRDVIAGAVLGVGLAAAGLAVSALLVG